MTVFKLRLLPSLMAVGTIALGTQLYDVATGMNGLSQPARALEDVPPAVEPSQDVIEDDSIDAAFLNRSEVELLRDLSTRREALDMREQQIAMQERLLLATEKRIDGKIAELKALESQIATLIGQHEEAEEQQLQNLVRVYEKMKAKDAAQIFQRLDLEIQVSVAQRMKDSKMAPMMAKMDRDAAKKLSTALAEVEALPQIGEEG